LFVSACGAPQCVPPLPPIGHLPDRELCTEVNRRYGGIPDAILADQDFLQAVLPTLRADICLLEAYGQRPPQPLSCPITAFGGSRDTTVPAAHVEAWRDQTSAPFECSFLEEGHLFLVSARERLIRQVREALAPAACTR
jgi:medium-chain acyl-[acyl-carrier-protein] hydrolase